MTTRRDTLFRLLATPLAAQLANPLPAHAGSTSDWPSYRTQPGTTELPPRHSPPAGPDPVRRLAWWNEAALRANAVDATPPYPGEPPRIPEQYGRPRASRALAIVHLAVFDAVNAVCKRYPPYAGALPAFADSSLDAAIAQAAHDTLAALYPRQAARFDRWLADDLARLPTGRATLNGIDLGRRAAAAILALRSDDGYYRIDPVVGDDYAVSNLPGHWRPDPVSGDRTALGAWWGRVRTFVLPASAPFRPAAPPALASADYTAAFNETRRLGGNGTTTPTSRSAEQTLAAIYWGYDGGAWIGTQPRQYNQIAVQLALARTHDAVDLARLLALLNAAIADATIVAWDSKYAYDFWRPVTGIREASPGSGPTGLGDGNPDTVGDPHWTPLGSPASNLIGPNFTPPFPAYPSGHAAEGGATFQVLRRFYGDGVAFTFVSDEYNGITRDNQGRVRPRAPRSFATLSAAEEENGWSRIYLGVHWRFDRLAGMALGRRVADYVVQRGLVQPGH